MGNALDKFSVTAPEEPGGKQSLRDAIPLFQHKLGELSCDELSNLSILFSTSTLGIAIRKIPSPQEYFSKYQWTNKPSKPSKKRRKGTSTKFTEPEVVGFKKSEVLDLMNLTNTIWESLSSPNIFLTSFQRDEEKFWTDYPIRLPKIFDLFKLHSTETDFMKGRLARLIFLRILSKVESEYRRKANFEAGDRCRIHAFRHLRTEFKISGDLGAQLGYRLERIAKSLGSGIIFCLGNTPFSRVNRLREPAIDALISYIDKNGPQSMLKEYNSLAEKLLERIISKIDLTTPPEDDEHTLLDTQNPQMSATSNGADLPSDGVTSADNPASSTNSDLTRYRDSMETENVYEQLASHFTINATEPVRIYPYTESFQPMSQHMSHFAMDASGPFSNSPRQLVGDPNTQFGASNFGATEGTSNQFASHFVMNASTPPTSSLDPAQFEFAGATDVRTSNNTDSAQLRGFVGATGGTSALFKSTYFVPTQSIGKSQIATSNLETGHPYNQGGYTLNDYQGSNL
ncbi:hypothetical protein GP486_005202 [Trichoglossum hirsutum]|uniref:Uncharacterized protein n=1 Tax=Trichoglossum hirsutum TaxID=265104 RepID=A0A9P8RN49_9PEZI|nr:hypothetical protein GP486_005202 [Trichoglossum hirsutum]